MHALICLSFIRFIFFFARLILRPLVSRAMSCVDAVVTCCRCPRNVKRLGWDTWMRRRSTAKSKSIPCRPIQTPETCPALSCPSISCLDISMVRHFHVRHYQRPPLIEPSENTIIVPLHPYTIRIGYNLWFPCSPFLSLSATFLFLPTKNLPLNSLSLQRLKELSCWTDGAWLLNWIWCITTS